MDDRVYELLNDQINKELYSAYLYLSFADYYDEEGLSGFCNWYEIQAQEERDHALIFRNYLHDNGCKVKLLAMITRMKLFGSNAKALYDLDQEFAARTYAVPSPLATAE